MEKVFLGSEALSSGTVTIHELRRWHRRIYPDVYVERRHRLTVADRSIGAWLWSHRRGVVAGVAASALHGADWVDEDVPVELIWNNGYPPRGLIVRNERLGDDETTRVAGVPVTTVTRTAYDLGRHLPRAKAVARLDALANATALDADRVLRLADRYKGARGVRRLKTALSLMDDGAESPKETWLRLLLIDAGLPRPTTQIVVHDGDFYPVAVLDMGWQEYLVAAEYDGDVHRSDRKRYVKDLRRLRMLTDRGWIVIRVVAEDHPIAVVARVRAALASRGCAEIELTHIPTRTLAA